MGKTWIKVALIPKEDIISQMPLGYTYISRDNWPMDFGEYYCTSAFGHIGSPCVFCDWKDGGDSHDEP